MKLIKYLSFLLPLFIVGCETTVGLNIDEVVTSCTESLSFAAEGGEDAIEFNLLCDWKASISEDADWLTLNKYSGNSGRNYIDVTAKENKTIEAREAVITIYNDIYEVSKEVTVYQEANDPYITLSNNELEFDKNESSNSIEVESNIPWSATIVSNPDWLTITPTKGDNGTTTLKVTVKGNNTIDIRSADIKIENSEYKLSKVLTITQSVGDANASVSSEEISIPSESNTKSIDIESNTTWKAKCDAEWISLSPTSGSKGKTTMTISAEENPYAESRTTTITIVDNTQKVLSKINVTQQGCSSTYINLSNNSIVVKLNIPYTLNIESTVTWAAEYDADIISVTPNSGIGKVDATITIIGQTTDSVDVRFYNDDFGVSTTLHITPDYTNCIFYTTSDGNIVSPHNSNAFGATIISNEIINGIGAITFNNSITTIGEEAFYDCDSLTSVTIPDGVTSIGNNAFYGCSSLTSITIPDGVTTIESSAFESCDSLTSVTIPDSVTTIGNNAFYGCSSLTSITIPDRVTSIGSSAFENCDSLTTVTIGNDVTSIGERAFKNCDSLTNINIPESVTSIGNEVFYGCTGELIINNKIVEKDYDWRNCPFKNGWLYGSKFTSLTIGNGVTTIGDYAFYDCSSLTSVTIPDSVTTIGEDAFYGCSSLTSVYISDIAAWWNISFGDMYSNPLYYARNLYLNNELVTDLIIPDSVTTIGEGAFRYCESLTSVTIPDSVTSIGGEAFYNCCSLISVTIGDSVTTIGEDAFYGCSSLTSVTIGYSVTTIGNYAFNGCSSLTGVYISDIAAWCNISFGRWGSNPLYYARNLYLNNELVTDLTIPDSVTTIGEGAFYNCSSLASVTIPDSVTTIGGYTFYGCSNLTSITIPDSVTTIGGFAFYDCDSLTSVTIPDSVTTIGGYTFYGCDSLTSVTIPDSVTTIGSSAFSGCDSLTSVTIPDSVTTIGSSAFYNCSSLTSVTIGNSVTTIEAETFYKCRSLTSVTIPDSVTTIGEGAFYGCDSLTSAPIGNSVTTIGTEAFRGCSFTSVTIPDSVTTIGEWAFSNCSSLTSVTIGDSVTTIGDDAFWYCRRLESVTIGDSVTSIGREAFRECSSLTSVTIPDSVTTIGTYAFVECSSLTRLYCKATTPPTGGSYIFSYDACPKIYVPMESVEAYKSAFSWKEYKSYIVGYNF